MGIGIMIVTFVLHAKKKLTVNLAVTWELLGIAAILSGAVPRFSGWSSRIGLGSLVVLLITALLVLWGVYQMTIQMIIQELHSIIMIPLGKIGIQKR